MFTLVFILVIIVSLAVPVILNESYKRNIGYKTLWNIETAIELYGSYLSFIGTFSLGYLIYVNNKNREIERYLNNGKILCSILDSTERQLKQFSNGNTTNISYDSQWIQYFFEFKRLKFDYSDDYFEVLWEKFETIDRINQDILKKDYINAGYKFHDYVTSQQISLNNFNIIEVTRNLRINAHLLGYRRSYLSWNYDEKLNRIIKDYSNRYFYVIENWIYNYLINSEKSGVKSHVFVLQLIEWLLSNKELKELCPSPYDKRIITKIILLASVRMKDDEESRISLIWGEYSLKEK